MNTKQSWNALTLNPVTNNNFDGIFSIDTLKEIKEKPTLMVCNTDPSDKAGEHWVLFFFHDNTVDFYDSLAHEITYYGSDLCGHYSLYYAFKKCEGHSMEDIINNFPTKDDLVDIVNKIFYICEFSQCSLLQCCSRY